LNLSNLIRNELKTQPIQCLPNAERVKSGLVKEGKDVIEITFLGKVILALMESDFIKDFVS
jgi:hypothetical protein